MRIRRGALAEVAFSSVQQESYAAMAAKGAVPDTTEFRAHVMKAASLPCDQPTSPIRLESTKVREAR
jgi:hypothetical protein